MSIPALTLNVGFFTQVSGFSAQVDVLEYPEGGNNAFVHRLPVAHQAGQHHAQARRHARRPSLLEWLTKTVVKAEPTNLSIKVLDFDGPADPDVVVPPGLPGQVDRVGPQRGRQRSS